MSICITINRKRTYQSTGFKILPKDWSFEKNEVRNTLANHSLINQSIKNKMNSLEAELLKRDLSGENISIQSLKKKKSKIIVEYIDQAIIDLKGKLSEGRIKHFQTERDRLHLFAPGLRFDEVDNSFLKRYEKFLRDPKIIDNREVKGLKGNTINSVWKIYIRIFNLARKDGITNNYPFAQYENPKYRQTIRTFLLIEEVQAIENLLKLPLLEGQIIVINYFLLGCYSGLRYSDWQRFSYDGFVQKDRIILGTKKTGEIISLNMHKRLKKVVERLKKLPPIFSGVTIYVLQQNGK